MQPCVFTADQHPREALFISHVSSAEDTNPEDPWKSFTRGHGEMVLCCASGGHAGSVIVQVMLH